LDKKPIDYQEVYNAIADILEDNEYVQLSITWPNLILFQLIKVSPSTAMMMVPLALSLFALPGTQVELMMMLPRPAEAMVLL
jgi:hypothetical protein